MFLMWSTGFPSRGPMAVLSTASTVTLGLPHIALANCVWLRYLLNLLYSGYCLITLSMSILITPHCTIATDIISTIVVQRLPITSISHSIFGIPTLITRIYTYMFLHSDPYLKLFLHIFRSYTRIVATYLNGGTLISSHCQATFTSTYACVSSNFSSLIIVFLSV